MKRSCLSHKGRNQGLTLVELMIAMVLSMVLLGGTIAIFLSTKQAYRTQEDLARIQENIRYGVTRFMREVSMGGYMGCAGSVKLDRAVHTVKPRVVAISDPDFADTIEGEEGVDGGPDKLTLRFARAETAVPVTAPMVNPSAPVYVDAKHPNYSKLAKDDVVVVSDCDAIAIFKITNEPDSSGILKYTQPDPPDDGEVGLEHVFGGSNWSSATVYRLDGVTFELDTKSTGGKTVSSLYATRVGGNQEPILAGVEDFQILYGIDRDPRDGTADVYLDWDQAKADASEITSLHIKITVNPGLPVKNEKGENEAFRKTTEFTVKLRNRTGDV